MNKSTPINQLPLQQNPQNLFVNDQQRQIITQAQQAINNSTMPQNTQLSNEIISDDDNAIQDMLNNLNSSSQQPDLQYIQQQQQLQQQQDEYLARISAMNNLNINQFAASPASQVYSNNLLLQQQQHVPKTTEGFVNQFTQLLTDDFKLAGIVFLVVIVVQFIPFHKYISKYIAIDKIPYHDVIFKGIMASLLVIIVNKLIK
jgi:hypothetical protein